MSVLRRYNKMVASEECLTIYEDAAFDLQDSLARAVASGADLSGIDLSGVHVDGAGLTNARFAGARIHRSVFTRCDLCGSDFRGASFEATMFEQCQLGCAAFDESRIEDTRFSQCDMWGASFQRARMLRASFVFDQLCDADFTGADLSSASFRFSAFSACGATEWQEARADLAADTPPWRCMEYLAEVLRRDAGKDRRKLHLVKLCWASRHLGEFSRIEHPDMRWALFVLGCLVKPPRREKSGASLWYPELLDEFLPNETVEWIEKYTSEAEATKGGV